MISRLNQLFYFATAIAFLLGCRHELSPDRKAALSSKFLNNCDFIESRLLENYRLFTHSKNGAAALIWQTSLGGIARAVEENLAISGILGTYPFEMFAAYLYDLNLQMHKVADLELSDGKLQPGLVGRPVFNRQQSGDLALKLKAELRRFQTQREQLIRHYLKLVQNASLEKISGTSCNLEI